MQAFDSLETALNYTFQDADLLRVALTHSSWANEYAIHSIGDDIVEPHNERLEFLGDAVLEMHISWELFTRFAAAREGDLTYMRSRLVNATFLAQRARELGLEECLRLGKGEEHQGGRHRDALLSDTLEAVLGAVYCDGGHVAARRVVRHIFAQHWPQHFCSSLVKDYKSTLQEATQRTHKDRPVYVLTRSSGPEHAKSFEVCLTLPSGHTFTAEGPSLKRAEQEAARLALEQYHTLCDCL